MDKVVIIMPTYNEAKNIKRMIKALFTEEFPKIKKAEMHLLVVDDNSPDGTGEIVKEASKKYKNLHLLQGEKQGLGWAYIRGMKYAMKKLSADAVIEMDADFQHPPKFVKPMVEAYLKGADYAIGSRYIPGGSVPSEWAFSRKMISFLGNLFIRLVLLKPKLHDLTTGFRLTRVKGVLDKIDLDKLMEPERFAYKVDLLYQSVKNAQKTVEVPLQFAPRKEEKSKFNPKEMISTFKVAIILGVRDKQRFIKFAVVGGVGFIINYVGLELLRKTAFVQTFSRLFLGLEQTPILKSLAVATFWSTALATEMAIISNFILNNIWTFKEKKLTNLGKIILGFFKFNLTSLAAVIFQPFIVGQGVIIFGDTSMVRLMALIFALVFVVIPWNYIMYNLFIWKTWKLPWSKKKA
ncbi:MAG: glycosyltransferase family 2 protein [Patescibacteria group bacterium]